MAAVFAHKRLGATLLAVESDGVTLFETRVYREKYSDKQWQRVQEALESKRGRFSCHIARYNAPRAYGCGENEDGFSLYFRTADAAERFSLKIRALIAAARSSTVVCLCDHPNGPRIEHIGDSLTPDATLQSATIDDVK